MKLLMSPPLECPHRPPFVVFRLAAALGDSFVVYKEACGRVQVSNGSASECRSFIAEKARSEGIDLTRVL
jgi:hypothetical protein